MKLTDSDIHEISNKFDAMDEIGNLLAFNYIDFAREIERICNAEKDADIAKAVEAERERVADSNRCTCEKCTGEKSVDDYFDDEPTPPATVEEVCVWTRDERGHYLPKCSPSQPRIYCKQYSVFCHCGKRIVIADKEES